MLASKEQLQKNATDAHFGSKFASKLVILFIMKMVLLSTRSGCPELSAAWPCTPSGMGHPQLLWATCSNASSSQ